MLLDEFSYVRIPDLSGDIFADIRNFFLENFRAETYSHVSDVAQTIEGIAHQFQLDKDACVQAAYFHDIAVVIKPDDMLTYARRNNMQIFPAEERYHPVLHQRFSSLIAKEHFGISDQRILSAVACHTTLKADPSPYDMTLFLADKLAWDQEGIPPFYDPVRDALDESLYQASLVYIEFVMEKGMILLPHTWLTEAYQWLIEYCSPFSYTSRGV